MPLFIHANTCYRKRAEIWDRMSSDERTAYLAANGNKGNKRYGPYSRMHLNNS